LSTSTTVIAGLAILQYSLWLGGQIKRSDYMLEKPKYLPFYDYFTDREWAAWFILDKR
jgi:hypothetical protein